MKHRIKSLLAVVLTAVIIINCIEISGYQTDASVVNQQTETQTDSDTLPDTQNPDADGADNHVTGQETDKSDTDTAENTTQDTRPGEDTEENTTQDTAKPGKDSAQDDSDEEDKADDEADAEDKILSAETEEDTFPRTPDDLEKKPEQKTYYVRTYEDVEALQELSRTSSLKGYTFEFGKLDDKEFTWDLTTGYKNVVKKNFEGFGSEEFPFQGTISEYIQSGATFKLEKPLFSYLGSGAQLTNFHMTLVNATSGIADCLVADSTEPVRYTNVIIGGTIRNTNSNQNDGAAGALYGTVINNGTDFYELKVDGTNAGVSIDGTSGLLVNGYVAGGFVGQTKGKVSVKVSDASGLAKAVYSSEKGIAGGIIGKLGAGGTFEVTSELTISNIVGRSASGAYSSNASAVGGLIGACENATVTSNKKVTKSSDIFIQGGTAGGFIGTATDSAVTISHFTLDGMIKTSIGTTNRTCIQGGVLGSYTTTEQTGNGDVTPLLDVSAIGIDKKQIAGGDDSDFTKSNVVKNGGIAGSITGDHVKIHDLSDADSDYPYMPSLGYDAYDAFAKYTDAGPGYTGGIAGEVTGKDITMYHLKLSFSRNGNCMLSGKRLGGLIGNVGPESKIRVTGVEISSLFTFTQNNSRIPEYAGGLFGYVAEGSIISLGAQIALPEATDTTADASGMGEEKQDTADIPSTGTESQNTADISATGEVTQDTTETAASADGEENAEAVAENDTNWQGVINLTGIDYRNADNTYGGLRAAKAKGYIAGGQNEALIYLEDGADYRKNDKALNKDDSVWMEDYYNSKKDYTLNDIGNYGGLYRNIKDGDTYVIDFDKEYRKEVTGTVAYADGTYTLKGTADALRLAIACNTFQAKDKDFALRFAADCFSQDSLPATGQSLLKANYKVTADLDLAEAGIFSLVRNDGSTDAESEKYAFSGTFEGQKADDGQTDKKVTIHMSIVSTQDHAGLFPYVNGATFNNLKLTGDIYYVTGFGGLAYHAKGNLTIDNVDQEMTMRTRGYVVNNNSINYYGGYVGYYELGDGTFACKNSVIAPDISNIRCQQIVGGLVGYLKTTIKNEKKNGKNIQISDVTIKSKLATDSKFQTNVTAVFQARMSGMIATLGKNNWINQADWAGVEKNVENATYANVSLKDITVDGAVIDASSITNNPQNVRATGGLLGYQWDNAEVTVSGDTGIKVTGNSTIKSRGHVGGLFTTFSGKLDFNSKITLDSMTMQDVQGEQKFSALLVADGRYAIISLDADKYTINNGQQNSQDDTQDSSAKVTVTGYANFDEIVGVSCELKNNYVNHNSTLLADDYYRLGGIVNIRMPAFKENMKDATNYTSYVNRISTQDNPYTRYYYNLFTDDYHPVTVKNNTATLDSPEDLMLWHLYLYTCSNSDKLKRFFKPYFHDEDGEPSLMTVNGNDTWNLTGTFDLKGYSFYPTRVTGGKYVGEEAVIKLYATDIAKGENAHKNNCDKRTPQASGRQQYLMHAGLFVASNNYKVSGITFQGTIANLGADSGALCSKYTGGTVVISGIILNGVLVDSYSDACGTGLLLGYVKGEQTDGCDLTLDGIQTTGYKNDVYAAGALIGQVGSLTATNVRVTMRHMKVEYHKDNKVFQYASFICKYYYSSAVSDSGENTSRIVLYTFTKKDANDNNVTYGEEMKAGVNYYDQDRDEALEKKIKEAENEYIPFIHHDSEDSRYIFVNPRNGNLDKGCGTYEDPYVISESGQLKTLYLYLTGSGAYEDIFKLATDITDQADETGKTEDTDSTDKADGKKDNSWKVNIPGTDGRCDVDNTTKVKHTLAKYTDKEFPGRDVLRTAYYQIEKDINLTHLTDMNDLALNSDFSGLGSEQYPFAGVIVGKKKTDGSYPSITLPESTVVMDNYGLIQYMMGGVVKDINIKQAQTTDGKNEAIKVSDKGSAAGVAAIVLGGDNIIDNVGVNMTLQLTLDQDAQTTAKTGAYAGDVRRGSVILRNLKASNFSNYLVCVNDNADTGIVGKSFAADGDLKYKRNSTVIGWVEDGYVLGYLSGTDKKADSPLLENAQLDITDKDIPLSYSFPIINGSYMDQGFTKDNKITVTRDQDKGFVLTMHNGQQLEMASLALNSDAFSIYDSGKYDKNTCTVSNSNAYDSRAICRKAAYSNVGCGYEKVSGNDKPADFTDATTKDDGQKHYPYVYEKYVDFSEIEGNYKATLKMKDSGDVNGAVISYLNWTFDDGNTYADRGPDVVTTYKLDVSEENYDLSIYGRSFRGFGSIYNKKYSAFKADFDGNNANVIINMNRDWDSTIEHAGMFNGLQTVRKKTDSNGEGGFVIQNLNIKNSHFKNSTRGAVGALTGYMKGRWTIKDVHLIRDTANQEASDTTPATVDVSGSGQVHAGGLVGIIDYYSTIANDSTIQDITFDHSGVTGQEKKEAIISTATNVGGIVGYVEGSLNNVYTYYGTITFTDCNVSYAQIQTNGGNAGGFIGRVGYSYANRINYGGYVGGHSVGKVTISGTKGTDNTFPGTVEHSTIKVNRQNDSTYLSAGGLVGVYAGLNDDSGLTAKGIVMDTVTVNSDSNRYNNDTYYVSSGIGGILGGTWSNHLTVSDITVKNSKIGDRTEKNVNRLPAGGIVGAAYIYNFKADDITISETNIESDTDSVAGIIGNNCVASTFTANGVTLNNSTLWSKQSAAGGVTGRYNVIGFSSNQAKPVIRNITVANCKILAGCTEITDDSTTKTQVTKNNAIASAGGVIGYADKNMYNLTISDVQVGTGTELAGYCTGGVIGYIKANTYITMTKSICIGCTLEESGNENVGDNDTTITYKKDSNPTILYGKWRNGGVVGSNESSGENKYSASIRIYNTKIAGYGTTSGSSTAMAAGLTGYEGNHTSTYDDVEVSDCMFAVINQDSTLNAAAGCLWAYVSAGTHRIYRPVLTDNSVGYVKQESLKKMKSLEDFKTITLQDLGLVYNHDKSNVWNWQDIKAANNQAENLSKATEVQPLNEITVAYYSYGVGNYVGTRAGGNVYILRPELKFTEQFSGNRPAIDVGNTSGNKAAVYTTNHGYGYPYDYRQNVNIVYFEPEKAAADKKKDAKEYLSDDIIAKTKDESMKKKQEDEYLFSSLDTIAEAYQDNKNTGEDFLNDYKLNVTVGGKKVIQADKNNRSSYYDKQETNNSDEKKYIKTLNGIQCLNADGVAAQDLLESMTDILTNTGGNGFLTIQAVSAKITNDGKIEENKGKKGSIEVNSDKKSIQYRSFAADEPLDGGYTITLLIYEYGWKGADGNYRSEAIYIPVFVVERISIFNDLHILEGEQYSMTKAKDPSQSYQTEVTVAHDSTYTLFSEFAYSSARNKVAYQQFTVSKKLKLLQQDTNKKWNPAAIPKGLQFTLVDVSTGKPYYYTSTGTEKEIAFTAFKDDQGKPYTYRTISNTLNKTQKGYTYGGKEQGKTEEFGLEQFFIYVEPSSDAEILNSIFKWSVSTEDTPANYANFMDESKEHSEIVITWMPGLDISFSNKEEGADGTTTVKEKTAKVEGAINKDQKVTVTAAINIMANRQYWNMKQASDEKFIDSENNGKYLDVAIYLIDKTTGSYVTLPPGTYLRLNDRKDGKPTIDQSVSYAYQQWGFTFPLSALTDNVQGWNQTIQDADGTYYNTFNLEMDFSGADLSEYVGNKYDIYMELRRTSDPKYPLEGTRLDTFSGQVDSYGNKELATSVEVKDIRDLGINTYRETTSQYEIPFTTKLDFANMIYNDADAEACAEKDYLITYRLKKKILSSDADGHPQYKYLSVGNAVSASGMKADQNLKLALADTADSGVTTGGALVFRDAYGTDGDREPVYQMIKRFSADEIRKGTNGVDYLMQWDMKLTVDTTDIEISDLSNYMVEVTVLPIDPDLKESEDTELITIDGSSRYIPKTDKGDGIGSSLKDYFIFTVGKLKTDL